MAQKVLILGESGTGKSTSLRNCDPATVAVVNPVGKPLPFKNHFEMLNNVTDARRITAWMQQQAAAGKKLIVVDDFQYTIAIPYMNRIKENGWDKYNDFGANYFDIIQVCGQLPDDVVVAFMSHLETLESGLTTVKLIGKLLREKITIEGLFTVVLRTGVSEGKYYFYTQNSGKDTVKSPLGMFQSYAIDNDLAYVADKIRNFYEVGDYKTDAEMVQADKAVAADIAKPDANGRRARGTKAASAQTATPADNTVQTADQQPAEQSAASPQTRTRRSRSEVEKENAEKMADYQQKVFNAIGEACGNAEEVPFEEAAAAADKVPKPEMTPLPRRTRRERVEAAQSAEQTQQNPADKFMDIPDDPKDDPLNGAMNLPEQPAVGATGRRRRTR